MSLYNYCKTYSTFIYSIFEVESSSAVRKTIFVEVPNLFVAFIKELARKLIIVIYLVEDRT